MTRKETSAMGYMRSMSSFVDHGRSYVRIIKLWETWRRMFYTHIPYYI